MAVTKVKQKGIGIDEEVLRHLNYLENRIEKKDPLVDDIKYLQKRISTKAPKEELSEISKILETKAPQKELKSIYKILDTKASQKELYQSISQVEKLVCNAQKEIEKTLFHLSNLVDATKVYQRDVTLTPAEVSALNATPQKLVASPGAGKFLQLVRYEALMTYNSSPYVVAADRDLSIGYEISGEISQLETTGFLDQTSDQMKCELNNSTSMFANEAIEVTVLNGELTGGDSDVKLRVVYRIIDSIF